MSKAQRKPAFKWMLILSAVLLVPALIFLGFWQLDRAEQKQQLMDSWSEQTVQTQLPSVNELSKQPYLNLELEGYFDHQRYFLLDNRFRQGQVGYEVVVPFFTEFSELVLVNLGWVVAPEFRANQPVVSIPKERIKIVGAARLIQPAFSLGSVAEEQLWPIRVQQLDIPYLSQLFGDAITPVEVRVKQSIVPTLNLDWPVAAMLPQKHLAYALQWFAMAAALLVLIIWSWRMLNREVGYE